MLIHRRQRGNLHWAVGTATGIAFGTPRRGTGRRSWSFSPLACRLGDPSTTCALPHKPLGPQSPQCADFTCNTLTVSGRRMQLAPFRYPLALCEHHLVRSCPARLWQGWGISDPGKHDASILSQIPCDTRQSKYLCNTPFATLVRFCCSTEGVLSDPQPRTWDRSLELRSPIDPAHARSRAPFHPHSPS